MARWTIAMMDAAAERSRAWWTPERREAARERGRQCAQKMWDSLTPEVRAERLAQLASVRTRPKRMTSAEARAAQRRRRYDREGRVRVHSQKQAELLAKMKVLDRVDLPPGGPSVPVVPSQPSAPPTPAPALKVAQAASQRPSGAIRDEEAIREALAKLPKPSQVAAVVVVDDDWTPDE